MTAAAVMLAMALLGQPIVPDPIVKTGTELLGKGGFEAVCAVLLGFVILLIIDRHFVKKDHKAELAAKDVVIEKQRVAAEALVQEIKDLAIDQHKTAGDMARGIEALKDAVKDGADETRRVADETRRLADRMAMPVPHPRVEVVGGAPR